ncbi:hypothetical protein BDN72DRAFT_809365 [Pluteus cervinus]|uniref:Uncharacterized protein n=1 Tax=Pluteus cervinus TaxID=181527 RepID=A0ACD3BCK2_9AGAR|nr:hypothetical protein BDN72DRAFT_809365 [Pluteus cervinus]
MQLFTPHHVQLLNACYPPSSALPTAGPEYSPNSQELSRLTYYASNHPSKLTKLGSELEKRAKSECRKAKAGSARYRTLLLITLAIIRTLATECRRDISLLGVSLISSVDVVIHTLVDDLEVVARAATVFTAWSTYTDGHLIGADAGLTRDYDSSLRQFASLSSSDKSDYEVRNRTRLVGLAALAGALSSEALYNDTTQFREQVDIILRPLILNLFHIPISVLDDQARNVKDGPVSPYLTGFRTRPVIERRAASIHVHIDGEKGPSTEDVANATLHSLYSLLEHTNGSQLGFVMQSCLNSLDKSNGWIDIAHCRWVAQKLAEWGQYQYRYAVPTWLVERLLEIQETPASSPTNQALVAMVTTIFTSPIPLVNLSTSDIIANLITLLLRRATTEDDDALLSGLIDCIASLGRHIYYSDQILDLTGELVSRLLVVEVQGASTKGKPGFTQTRSKAVRCLVASLLGLLRSADEHDSVEAAHRRTSSRSPRSSTEVTRDTSGQRASRRTKVPLDLWQDTLSLLCDSDYAVRVDYCQALLFYAANEMPAHEDAETPNQNANITPISIHAGDPGVKFLHAIHAYVYILATTSTLGLISNSSSPSHATPEGSLRLNILPATPIAEHPDFEKPARPESPGQSHYNGRRSFSVPHGPRSRKVSVVQQLLERTPSQISNSTSASLGDYAHVLDIIETLHKQMPVRSLLTAVPMLLALNAAASTHDVDDVKTVQRVNAIREVIARAWLFIGQTWDLKELVVLTSQSLSKLSVTLFHSPIHQPPAELFSPPREAIPFPPAEEAKSAAVWSGVDAEVAISIIASSLAIQRATGLTNDDLLRRLSIRWTASTALRDSVERTSGFDFTLRGDGLSPLLKISPALMHSENISLHSLARSTRGVGVTDLREALEGRSSMSNPNLARPPSISTLDHTSSILGSELNRLAQTRSRSRTKKRPPPAGDVRDVLNRLGIGKQNGSLLKASFPALTRPDNRPKPAVD